MGLLEPGLAQGAALVLGAGAGRRAGGPKALRTVAGRAWWRWQVDAVARCAAGRVACVVPASCANESARDRCVCVPGPAPDTPMFASLQLGLRALGEEAWDRGVFVLPVDVPAPHPDVWRMIGREAGTHDVQAVSPRVGDSGGHPVWMSARLCARVIATDPALGRLDALLGSLGPHRAHVEVPVALAAWVTANLNTPEAWDAIARGAWWALSATPQV